MANDEVDPLLPDSNTHPKVINYSTGASSPPPCETDEKVNSGSSGVWSWRKSKKWLTKWWFFTLLPVEGIVFIFIFGVYFQMQLYQQYYYQRIFRDVISNWTNLSDLNYSIYQTCLNQDQIVNLSSPDAFVNGQKTVNNYSMLTTIAYLLPSILISPFIGTLSDQIGRKPPLIFIFTGQMLAAVLGLCIVYFDLNMLCFLATSFITGASGGFGLMLSSSFAYVTDITPTKWLTIRMALLEASVFVGTGVSSAFSDNWIQLTNCSFRPQVWLVLSIVACGLLYSFLIPESLCKENRVESISNVKCGFARIMRGFKLFFCPNTYIVRNLWKIWLIVLVIGLAMINETGNSEISSYFLHNKPLQWNYSTIGLYLALTSVSHLLALVVLLPIMVLLKFPDALIAIIGLLVSCGMNVYVALLTNTAEMFSVGVIIGVQSVVIPSLRSILAKFLKEEDHGAAFSLVAVFQLLATLIASVAFNQVYRPEDLDNKRDNPSVVYWMAAGLWASAIPLVIVVYWMSAGLWASAIPLVIPLLLLDVIACFQPKKTNLSKKEY